MKVKSADVTGSVSPCNTQNDWPCLEVLGGLTNRTSFNLSKVFMVCVCVSMLPGGLSYTWQSGWSCCAAPGSYADCSGASRYG